MDGNLLENILNRFPNIKKGEEFYEDISDSLMPLSDEEYAYTNLSLLDFSKTKGILKLSKFSFPNSVEVNLPKKTLALNLKRHVVINKDLLNSTLDLDNKCLRLSLGNVTEDNTTSTVENMSRLQASLNDLKETEEKYSIPDKGNLYPVHIHRDGDSLTYHWTVPEASDMFLMPRLAEKEDKGPVKRLITHPRAKPIHKIKKDEEARRSSQLSDEETIRYLGSGIKNLGTLLGGDEGAGKGIRLYLPESTQHPIPGYIRSQRSQNIPEGRWKHEEDLSTLMHAIAIAERMFYKSKNKGKQSPEDITDQEKLTPSDIKDFIEKYSDSGYGIHLGTLVFSDKFKQALDEHRKDPIVLQEDTEGPQSERYEIIGKLLQKETSAKRVADLLDPTLLGTAFKIQMGTKSKLPIRALETLKDKRYKKAISKLSRSLIYQNSSRTAIEHLMSGLENIIPEYRIKLEDAIEEGNQGKIEKLRKHHDALVLTYLSTHLGTRLGDKSDKNYEKKKDSESIALATITPENIKMEGKDMFLRYTGKLSSKTNIKITDPYLKHLLKSQLKLHKGKDDERIFRPGPVFFTTTKSVPEAKKLLTDLDLLDIPGYSFRYYRGTKVGIEEAYRQARDEVAKYYKDHLRGKSAEDIKDAIKKINSHKVAYDLDLSDTSRIVSHINRELSHAPGADSWRNYADPRYLREAYRLGILKYLKTILEEAR